MANPLTIPQVYKDPAADLDFGFDLAGYQTPPFKAWLSPGETVTNLVVTATDGITINSSGIYPNTDGFPASLLLAWISGGTVGYVYTIHFQWETSLGRTDVRSVQIIVMSR